MCGSMLVSKKLKDAGWEYPLVLVECLTLVINPC
jgi:hypothetical protein